MQDDGKVKNQIINHYAILLTTSQKLRNVRLYLKMDFQLNISVKNAKSTVKQLTLSQMYCLNVFMIFLQENR